MYKDKSNDTFKNLLVVCLLKAFVAKMSGELNPVYSPNVFNFYLALSATSRKSFEFVSGNLLGPAIRQIQRRRENHMGRNPFISYDLPIVEAKMRALLVRLSDSLGGGRLAFSLAIDGTKVPQTKQISQKYKTIIGGSHPNHFITLDGLSDEEVKVKLLNRSDSSHLAAEVRVVVMSCQPVPKGEEAYSIIVCLISS